MVTFQNGPLIWYLRKPLGQAVRSKSTRTGEVSHSIFSTSTGFRLLSFIT